VECDAVSRGREWRDEPRVGDAESLRPSIASHCVCDICDNGRSLMTKAQSGRNRREGLLSSRHKTQYVQAIGETVRATSEKLAKTLPR
jgi:hypothetical protein